MKKVMNTARQLISFFVIFFLFPVFAMKVQGQCNLVPNPSFEEYNQCPNADAQFSRVNHWVSFRNNPDYQNACDTTNKAGVPNNIWGYQSAASGQAYAGMLSFSSSGNQSTSFREYLGAELISPLTIGTRYYVSLKVSPTLTGSLPFGSVKYVHNKLGVLFTTTSSSQYPITNFAHVIAIQL